MSMDDMVAMQKVKCTKNGLLCMMTFCNVCARQVFHCSPETGLTVFNKFVWLIILITFYAI